MTLLHALLRRLRLPAGRSPSRPAMEACEPKLLYSADPLGLYGALAASAEVQTLDAGLIPPPAAAPALDDASAATPVAERTEIVVIDSRIADRQALLDDLAARAGSGTRFETLVLERSDHAIARIGETLAGRQDIAALHILSHGAEGQLVLGDRVIDGQTLQQRASELGTWRDAFTADADILLYGCDVGAGEAGQTLVQQLAQLTAADVAASRDDTGSAARGGNWLLEIQSGAIDTTMPFSASLMDSWDGSLATFVVTSTGDSGGGTLREAIDSANANGIGLDLITFNIAGTGIHTITLGSSLMVTGAVSIDATTDDSFAANGSRPAIVINGNTVVQDGFQLYTNSSGSTIRGFVIQNFAQDGIDIASSNGNTIVGNWIGLNSAGTGAAGNQQGVNLWNANNNVIGGGTAADRNVISASSGTGVNIGTDNGTSTGNQIRGNYIGTNAAGTAALGNSNEGIYIGAANNTVGGTVSGQGNVISGTGQYGGILLASNAPNTLVAGNLIGLNAAGTAALGNAGGGLIVYSANNTIGGTTAAARNVISGNSGPELLLYGASATGNVVIGNYIGLNAAGTADADGAYAAVGGDDGIAISGGASGNRIGTNADGSNDAAERNVIAGYDWVGINVYDAGTTNNRIQGNYIGTDATGLTAIASGTSVSLYGVSGNFVGSGLAGAGNVVAGTVYFSAGASNNRVQGNFIGLGSDGSTTLGTAAGSGVWLDTGGSTTNITGNIIGTDADGSNDAGERNVISGLQNGVLLVGTRVTGNTVAGNYIGTDATGSLSRGNTSDGVRIEGGATNNTVGGTSTVRRNLISGNGQDGIQIADETSDGNTVRGNWIGVNAAGTAILGNGGNGIFVSGGADNSLIGGTGANDGNWIAGNGVIGIEIDGASTGTVIQGNRIGTNLDGSADWGHGQNGILLENGASSTLIGGTVAGAGNTIAFNGKGGVYTAGISVTGATSQNNVILGNSITQNVGLGIDLGGSGVTPNDPGDTDTGPNGLLNTLTLTGAVTNGSTLDLTGSYGGAANTYYRLEFFSSPTADASGYGEGRTYLGSVNMPIGPTGTISGSYNLAVAVSAGEAISATVTRTDSSYTTFYETSEFANTVTATSVNTAPSDLYMVPGVAESGLIGVYTFSAAASLGRDDAGGQAPITLYGSPVQTTGPSGSGALDLAGGASGQYGNIAGITTGGAMTIAAQVRFDSTGDWQRVVDFGQANSTGITAIYVGRLGSSNDLTFTLEKDLGGGSLQVYRATATGAIVNGSWMHFAATVDGSGAMSLYINGTLAASGVGAVPEVGVRSNNYIGESNWGADALFDGAIDNLVLARSALTAEQVATLYQQSNAFSVTENAANGTVLGTVLVSDAEAGSSPTYSLVGSAGGRFAVAADGTLTVANGSLLDFESATSHTITVRGTDPGGLWREESYSVAVTDINDAPSGANATLTLAEDSTRTFTLADFGFTDADGDALQRVWIDTLPGSGSLRWNGATFAAGNWVSAADIAAGQLSYLPQPDAAGAGLASFSFRVQDDGGTAGGGSNVDATANTITLDVTAVNDAPIITHGGTNLVSNGSFESGSTGWVSNGSIEVSTDPASYGQATAADGSAFLEVEGWGATAAATYVEQTVATTIGQTYTLRWSVATRNDASTADMGSLSVNGVELDRFTAGTDWSERYVSFTATSTSSTLRFTSLGSQTGSLEPNDGGGLLLDFVRMRPVGHGVAYAEGDPAIALMPGFSVLDLELSASDNFNGATLTLARSGGPSAQDLFSGTGTLAALTPGAALVVGGTTIGTVTANGGGTLVLSFNANATNQRVNEAARQIAYANDSDTPPASVQIDWTFSDGNTGTQGSGGALTATGRTTVSITPTNDAPSAVVSTRYLSDQSPVATSIYNLTFDLSHESRPIVLDGVSYAKGLGTHPGPSGNGLGTVDYSVGGATSFKATLGVNDYQTGTYGSVRFMVYLDGVEVYASGVMTSVTAPLELNIDTTGATTLRIAVDNGGDGNGFDHGVWANARLEGGSVALAAVPEGSANGSVVGSVVARDADSPENWTYSLTNSAGGRFAIDALTGRITVANGSLLDFETASSHAVTVRATDTGGLWRDEVFAIAVTDVNDAPALDAGKSPQLSMVAEGNGAPVGAVGTLVSSLVDLSSVPGGWNNVTDADAGAQVGLAVTAADTSRGTWWFSLDGGTNWQALGAVSDSAARLLAADGSTRLYLQAADNGDLASAITFRAWDRSTGANGGVADTTVNGGSSAFSTQTDTAGIQITNVAPTLSLSGSATASNGGVYTLTLSATDPGADTISGWTIHWGDGTVSTVAGNPGSVTHSYTGVGFTYGILATATDEDGSFSNVDVLVSSLGNDQVKRYDGATGGELSTLVANPALDGPTGSVIGPDGRLYVAGASSGNVVWYDLDAGTTGVFVAAGSGGLAVPNDLAFGADGHLYVASYDTDEVLRYDGSTGAFIDVFVAAGIVDAPSSLAFGRDGQLYVGGWFDGDVHKIDATTGARIGAGPFASVAAGWGVASLAFGPDGALYIGRGDTGELFKHDGTTGALLSTLSTTATPYDIAIGPDGMLWVSDFNANQIERFDTGTGSSLGYWKFGLNGISGSWGLSFAPDQQVTVLASQAPVIAQLAGDNLAYTEGDGASVIDQGTAAQVSDIDSSNFAGGTLTVSIGTGGVAAQDVLGVRHQGTGGGQIGLSGTDVSYGGVVFGSLSGGTGGTPLVISFDADATPSAVAALLANITYLNSSVDAPTAGVRTLGIVLTDGDGATSANVAASVSVSAVNDAPSLALPGIQTTPVNTALVLSTAQGRAIQISDVDAGASVVQLSLSVVHGSLTLASTAGLSFSSGDGTADASLAFSGTLAAVNAALDGLSYTPTAAYEGGDTLSVSTSDLGNTGSGGALGASGGLSILVGAIRFQEGTAGYTGTQDTYLSDQNPSTAYGNASTVVVDYASPVSPGLIRFDNLFGSGAGQVPFGSTITAATLSVYVTDADAADIVTLHRMLAAWSEASTHDTLVSGVQFDNVEGASTASAAIDAGLSGWVNITGLVADVQAWLNGAPNEGWAFKSDMADNWTFASSESATLAQRPYLSISYTPPQAPVVGTSGGSAAYVENGSPVAIDPGLTLNDADSSQLAGATVAITGGFVAGQDVLGFANQSGITGSYDAGTGVLTLIGSASVAQYQAALRSVTYTNSSDAPGTAPRSIGFSANDAWVGSSVATRSVTVTAVNDAPVLGFVGGSASYPEGSGAVVLAPFATVSDVDSADFDGGAMQVSITANGQAEDRIAIRHQGTGAGQIGVSGANVSYGGTLIGTFSGGTDGSTPLVISFNANASVAAVQALARHITYQNVSDAPSTAVRTIQGTVTDGDGGTSNTASGTLSIVPVNDAPSGTDTTITMAEDGTRVLTAADFGFTDVDGHALAQVRIATLPVAGSLRLNGVDVLAGDIVTAAQLGAGQLVWAPAADANGSGLASFTFQVQDDGGTANGGVALDPTPNTLSFDVTAVNDAPIHSMPGVQVTPVNTPLVLSTAQGRAIQVSDVDAAASSVQLSLSVLHGTLTLATTTGLSFSSGDGTADASLVFSGTLAAVNAALDGLSYTPTTAFEGDDTLTLTTNDLGHTGSGGALSDTDALTIHVGAVSFQQGVGGYSGTEDTFVRQYEASNAFGNDTTVELNSWSGFAEHGLIRFDNLFGSGPGQIPIGATITGATLSVYVSHPNDTNGGSTVSLHRMLQGWSEASTWSAMTNGVQTDGSEAAATASSTVSATQGGWVAFTNLAADLQAWAAGGSNFGWALITDDIDAWNFHSSETGTASLRPYLSISYAPPQAPVVGTSGGSVNFVENGSRVVVDPGLTLSDADGTVLTGATVRIAAGYTPSQDQLSWTLQPGIISSWNGATGTLTFSGTASIASYQTVLRSLGYANTSDAPNTATRTLSFQVTDGLGVSNIATRDVTITAVNDAPGIASDNLAPVAEDTVNPPGASVAALFGAGFNDPDAGASLAGIVVTSNSAPAAQGTWQYSTDGGSNWLAVGSVGVNGLALDAGSLLRFVPAANYAGTPTALALRGLDNSYAGSFTSGASRVLVDTGSPGGSSAISAILVSLSTVITSVNDAPTSGASGATAAEDSGPVFIWLSGNDVDGTVNSFRIDTLPAHGTLYADAALTQVVTAGSEWATTVFNPGSQLRGLYFVPAADWNGVTGFSYTTRDDAGLYAATPGSATLTITAVNDAPTGQPVITGTPTEDQTLTADTTGIGDADGLGTFGYQWLRGGVAIAGATGASYTPGDADVGASITVRVDYVDAQGTAESLTSAAVGPVAPVNDAPTGLPAITGTPTEDQTLTVDTGGIGDADGLGAFSVQWLRDGVAIAGATGATLVLGDADVGALISVRVDYLDGQGTAESLTSAAVGPVANVNDTPSGLPSITGTPTEDQTLTVDTTGITDADGLGAFSVQWLRGGVAIAGANGSSYTLGDADVGASITVRVSYLDGQGTAESLTSAALGPVANVNDMPTGLPLIGGSATEDQTLTLDTTSIADADGLGAFSVQWLRGGVAISGANGSSYTLGDADVGALISVRVDYVDGQGTAESLTSAAVGPVANVNDTPIGLPTIAGTPTEDQTLTADTSGITDADGLGGFSLQWLRDGVAISGANGSGYTLGDADVGALISVRVDYLDGQGTAESLTSAAAGPVANVNDMPTGLPLIGGSAIEDQTLTVDTSGITDADGPGAFSLQWLRDGVAISGAGGNSYTLGDADVGRLITVRVDYLDAQGMSETLTSAAVGPVANVNDAPTGLPVISGTPTEDQTLTVDTSAITDADGLGTFSLQWLRGGVAISGANGSSYTLGDADVGASITVRVDCVDGQGTAESLTSAAAGPVANVNDTPAGLPTITGTPTEDQTLTVDTSAITDADGLGGFSLQWLRDGVAISGATGNSYTLADVDVGRLIAVRVAYVDAQGTAESLTSAAAGPVLNVNDAPTGLPVLIGTASEDQTLSVDTSGIADIDGLGAFSMQWLRDGVAVAGATGASYTLGDADVGASITVRVGYVDGHGTTESVISAAVGPVANVNDAPTGLPVIIGTPIEDQTLTVDATVIADADGLGPFSLQWLRDGAVIGGATGSSYTLGDADVGASITVRVDYVDGQGTAESLGSAALGPVANVDDPLTGAPALIGAAVEDGTLSVDTGSLADADGLGTIAWQWLRDGVAIAGANGASYTLGDADVGARISVRVDHVDARGTAESLVSAPSAPVDNVNDAPVLAAGADVLLQPIDEDDRATAGQSVADLLAAVGAGAISDADRSALRGIAIHLLDSGNGRWQFSLDAGSTWVDAGSVSPDAALLLRDVDWLRLLPDGMNGTQARFEFQAWDQTGGTAGERVDATSAGGATAFSATSRRASLEVLDVNDAPTISSGGGQSVVELSLPENATDVMTLAAADVDLPAQAMAWRIAGGADAAWFGVDAATGQLNWRQPADFEARADADGDNVYEFSVQVNDGLGGQDEQSIRIVLGDRNEAPLLDVAGEVSVTERAENGTAVLQLQALDVDAGDRWSFTLVNDAEGRFGLDAAKGLVLVKDGARLDAALNAAHTIVVRVTDLQGLSDERSLRVRVAALPVTPTLPETGPVTPGPVAPVDPIAPPAPPAPPAPSPPKANPDAGRETATGNPSEPGLTDTTNKPLRVDPPAVEPPRVSGSGPDAGSSSATTRVELRDAMTPLSGVSFDFSPVALLDAAGQATTETFTAVSELIARSWSIGSGGGRGSEAEQTAEDGGGTGSHRDSTLDGFVGGMMEPANVASVSVTAGFVWWLTRGGGMLATVLMGVPAWRHIDLLPVMARDLDDEDEDDDDDKPEDSDLDGMFDRRTDKAPDGGRRG